MNFNLSRLRAIYDNWHEPEYASAYADIYWRALISLACAVAVITCIYSTNLYFSVLSDIAATVPEQGSAPSPTGLDHAHALLDVTISGIAARQANFQGPQANAATSTANPSQ